MEQQFKNYESVKKITKTQAEAMATQKVDFCNGLYKGYICDLPPYYGVSLLVFDSETHRLVYDNLGIHHTHKYINGGFVPMTDDEKASDEIDTAKSKLFDVAEITTTPPKSWQEQRNRRDFVINIYPKRYKYTSAFYIGKPSQEQKEAEKTGFISFTNYGYFDTKEHATDVDTVTQATREQADKQLNNFDYLVNAMVCEFFNFECMYSERYDEAIASVGILGNMTKTQLRAYREAIRQFKQELSKREY